MKDNFPSIIYRDSDKDNVCLNYIRKNLSRIFLDKIQDENLKYLIFKGWTNNTHTTIALDYYFWENGFANN